MDEEDDDECAPVKCEECGFAPLDDNRSVNEQRVRDGHCRFPNFKCSACNWVMWETPVTAAAQEKRKLNNQIKLNRAPVVVTEKPKPKARVMKPVEYEVYLGGPIDLGRRNIPPSSYPIGQMQDLARRQDAEGDAVRQVLSSVGRDGQPGYAGSPSARRRKSLVSTWAPPDPYPPGFLASLAPKALVSASGSDEYLRMGCAFYFGVSYDLAAAVAVDYPKAYSCAMQAANMDRGNALASALWSLCLWEGRGVPSPGGADQAQANARADEAKGRGADRLADAGGDCWAMLLVGMLYYSQIGAYAKTGDTTAAASMEKAMLYFTRAGDPAGGNHPVAQVQAGICCSGEGWGLSPKLILAAAAGTGADAAADAAAAEEPDEWTRQSMAALWFMRAYNQRAVADPPPSLRRSDSCREQARGAVLTEEQGGTGARLQPQSRVWLQRASAFGNMLALLEGLSTDPGSGAAGGAGAEAATTSMKPSDRPATSAVMKYLPPLSRALEDLASLGVPPPRTAVTAATLALGGVLHQLAAVLTEAGSAAVAAAAAAAAEGGEGGGGGGGVSAAQLLQARPRTPARLMELGNAMRSQMSSLIEGVHPTARFEALAKDKAAAAAAAGPAAASDNTQQPPSPLVQFAVEWGIDFQLMRDYESLRADGDAVPDPSSLTLDGMVSCRSHDVSDHVIDILELLQGLDMLDSLSSASKFRRLGVTLRAMSDRVCSLLSQMDAAGGEVVLTDDENKFEFRGYAHDLVWLEGKKSPSAVGGPKGGSDGSKRRLLVTQVDPCIGGLVVLEDGSCLLNPESLHG